MQSESAVVSITLRPRSIASRCVSSGRKRRVGIGARVAVVDALDAVLAHQDRLGADLERAQRGGRVGREERVAGAGGEDDDRGPSRGGGSRLRRMYGSATSRTSIADETRVCAPRALERVLQRDRVQQRREHARVVGRGAVHPLGRGRHAAVDVAAADHDRDLDAARR